MLSLRQLRQSLTRNGSTLYEKLRNYSKSSPHGYYLCNYNKRTLYLYQSRLIENRYLLYVNSRTWCRFFQKKNEFYRHKTSLTSLAITNYPRINILSTRSRTPSILLLPDANIIQRFLARTDSVQIILECLVVLFLA